MKRLPSIHISSTDLAKVLDKVIGLLELEIEVPTSILVKHIMSQGKTYSLNSRSLLVDTKKVNKKVTQLSSSSMDDASAFSKYLQLIRKQNHHRGINIIKEGSKEWGILKEVTKLAITFAEDFGIDRDEAFKEYIGIGVKLMGKFTLVRFNSIHQQICEQYEAISLLNERGISEQAELAHEVYRQKIIDRTGSAIQYKDFPTKFICFVDVADKCKRLGIDINSYISAQFEGLDWAGGIPEPHSLLGPKSDERLQKYLYKNKINLNEQQESKPKINWSKIKNGKGKD